MAISINLFKKFSKLVEKVDYSDSNVIAEYCLDPTKKVWLLENYQILGPENSKFIVENIDQIPAEHILEKKINVEFAVAFNKFTSSELKVYFSYCELNENFMHSLVKHDADRKLRNQLLLNPELDKFKNRYPSYFWSKRTIGYNNILDAPIDKKSEMLSEFVGEFILTKEEVSTLANHFDVLDYIEQNSNIIIASELCYGIDLNAYSLKYKINQNMFKKLEKSPYALDYIINNFEYCDFDFFYINRSQIDIETYYSHHGLQGNEVKKLLEFDEYKTFFIRNYSLLTQNNIEFIEQNIDDIPSKFIIKQKIIIDFKIAIHKFTEKELLMYLETIELDDDFMSNLVEHDINHQYKNALSMNKYIEKYVNKFPRYFISMRTFQFDKLLNEEFDSLGNMLTKFIGNNNLSNSELEQLYLKHDILSLLDENEELVLPTNICNKINLLEYNKIHTISKELFKKLCNSPYALSFIQTHMEYCDFDYFYSKKNSLDINEYYTIHGLKEKEIYLLSLEPKFKPFFIERGITINFHHALKIFSPREMEMYLEKVDLSFEFVTCLAKLDEQKVFLDAVMKNHSCGEFTSYFPEYLIDKRSIKFEELICQQGNLFLDSFNAFTKIYTLTETEFETINAINKEILIAYVNDKINENKFEEIPYRFLIENKIYMEFTQAINKFSSRNMKKYLKTVVLTNQFVADLVSYDKTFVFRESIVDNCDYENFMKKEPIYFIKPRKVRFQKLLEVTIEELPYLLSKFTNMYSIEPSELIFLYRKFDILSILDHENNILLPLVDCYKIDLIQYSKIHTISKDTIKQLSDSPYILQFIKKNMEYCTFEIFYKHHNNLRIKLYYQLHGLNAEEIKILLQHDGYKDFFINESIKIDSDLVFTIFTSDRIHRYAEKHLDDKNFQAQYIEWKRPIDFTHLKNSSPQDVHTEINEYAKKYYMSFEELEELANKYQIFELIRENKLSMEFLKDTVKYFPTNFFIEDKIYLDFSIALDKFNTEELITYIRNINLDDNFMYDLVEYDKSGDFLDDLLDNPSHYAFISEYPEYFNNYSNASNSIENLSTNNSIKSNSVEEKDDLESMIGNLFK